MTTPTNATAPVLARPSARVVGWHVALLTLGCALLYLPSLTEPGLANWQESQRALVAREMQARAEWIVPTVHGKPYLAKPPMIYWCQLGLAAIRGERTSEVELRLTVALAGWLGVLATYLVARRAFRPWPVSLVDAHQSPPESTALWAGLLTATGFLYTHSSRMGELDILLAPLCVVAIGCVLEAWRHADRTGRTHWPALFGAVAATSGAALTKGPPAILPIGIAVYGGMALHACFTSLASAPPARPRRFVSAVTALAAAGAGVVLGQPHTFVDWIGIALFALAGAAVGWLLGGLANPGAPARIWRLFTRTHPLLVLGAPLLAYFGWLALVAQRIGADAVRKGFDAERADNLRLFVPESPINNLEAAAYGAGLGSFCAIAALVWFVVARVRPGPVIATLLAWCICGLIAFSVLGKGVPRYLTPLWPGLSLLGAVWLVEAMTNSPHPARFRRGAIAAVTLAALVLACWYGFFRDEFQGDRSPRSLVTELNARGVPAAHLAQFEFNAPALAYYTDFAVPSYLDTIPGSGTVNVGPETIEDLKRQIAAGRETVLLVREPWPERTGPAPSITRLRDLGFALEPLDLKSVFLVNNGASRIAAYRARIAAP